MYVRSGVSWPALAFGRCVLKDLTLLLCDREEDYAQLLTEYLLKQKGIRFKVCVYTSALELLRQEKTPAEAGADILLLAESAWEEELPPMPGMCVVILEESNPERLTEYPHISKYQSADRVLGQLLELYAQQEGRLTLERRVCGATRIIGFYSPVHRCLQTTLAGALSQALAEKGRTLYLNLEYLGETSREEDHDLADLLYFLKQEGASFRLRLESMLRRKGALDYIPAMKAGDNLLGITPQEWLLLLERLDKECGYEYLVLDLSESVQGLLEILRYCTRVLTITRKEPMAQVKERRYRGQLSLYHYEDILDKTYFLSLPQISMISGCSWEEGVSGLSGYVQELLEELLGKE